jgi:exopolysaccharide biosynthesis operon protein EpsL
MVRRRARGASGLGCRAAPRACLRLREFSATIIVASVLAPAMQAHALWDDRLELFVAESVTRDDNVFRLSSARSPADVGLSSKGDTYRTTSYGLNIDVPAARQRFLGGVTWSDQRYDRFTFLDLTGRSAQAVWAWQLGNDLSGQLAYRETIALASFANVIGGGVSSIAPNPLKTQHALFNAGYQLTPRWELRGEVSRLKRSNELPLFQVNDIAVDGADLTVSYVTPAKNKLGFGVRAEEGRNPNPQVVRGSLFENAYRQESIAAVADWTPTGHSHVSARAGRVRRNFEQLQQRDFEGSTLNATYDWNPTGNFTLSALAAREISTTEEVNVGFVLVKAAALRPTLRLTERIRILGTFEYSEREYQSDPTQVAGTPPRIDHVRSAGVAASYRPVRQFTLELAYRRESRTSSVAFGDYVAHIANAGVRVAF